MNQEAVLHIHIKKLKVINANENKRGIKNEMQRKKQ